MKNIFLIILVISFQIHAEESPKKLNTFENLQKISEKKLNNIKDLELIKRTLKILIELDDTDPSRTGPAIMATSYGKYEALYKKAAKEIETKKNKQTLKEILQVMKTLNESGNG